MLGLKPLSPTAREGDAVEAGITEGWGHFVGLDGLSVGIDRFGASAPYQVVYEKLGVTAEAVVRAARAALSRL